MIEVVHTVHPLPSYGDDIKHQAIHLPVLHHSEDLQLTQDAGGGHGDVLEDNEDLKALVFSCPRQARADRDLGVKLSFLVVDFEMFCECF